MPHRQLIAPERGTACYSTSLIRRRLNGIRPRPVNSIVGHTLMHSKLIATFTLIIALAGGGVACLSLAGDCSNQIIKQIPSPNGKMKAVVFQRDCGATTGFNTQVSVLLSNQQLPDEGGNVPT
jgi:hypothetical protein